METSKIVIDLVHMEVYHDFIGGVVAYVAEILNLEIKFPMRLFTTPLYFYGLHYP